MTMMSNNKQEHEEQQRRRYLAASARCGRNVRSAIGDAYKEEERGGEGVKKVEGLRFVVCRN